MTASRRSVLSSVALVAAMSALACAAAPDAKPPPISPAVGGANSPKPSPPPKLVIQTGVLGAGTFSVKVPTGSYEAPKGGAPNHAVPGPIVAFKAADGVWRGHGYLETYPRLLRFEGTLDKTRVRLTYTFEKGKTYRVELTVKDSRVLLAETSDLGPRNLYVFDCYYGGWLPAAGFALNLRGDRHAFLYLPCYYDKPEVTIRPAGLTMQPKPGMPPPVATKDNAALLAAVAKQVQQRPAAVAVTSGEAAKRDVAGFWCRDVASWRNADRMGIQLWQRRQLPGDPASRHFLGPETKSDSTPNPRTAALLGQSLYEGHVTIELSLGRGTRRLGFAAAAKGKTRKDLPEPFKKRVQANP